MNGVFADTEVTSWAFTWTFVAVVAAGWLAVTLVRAWRDSSAHLDRDLAELSADADRVRLHVVENYANQDGDAA